VRRVDDWTQASRRRVTSQYRRVSVGDASRHNLQQQLHWRRVHPQSSSSRLCWTVAMPRQRLSPYARARRLAALADPAIAPCLTFANNVYPEDVGISADFQCIIW